MFETLTQASQTFISNFCTSDENKIYFISKCTYPKKLRSICCKEVRDRKLALRYFSPLSVTLERLKSLKTYRARYVTPEYLKLDS